MAQIILDSNNNLIQGDFDNATLNNRTKLQTTTTNATTNVYVVPNGSSTSAGVSVANNSSLTNASKIVMATNGTTDTQIISGVNGSGTYLPLSFYVNNTLALQISTAGVVSAPYGGFSGAGMTLLGTLTTTSGTSATLSGLTLTNYKYLQIGINNVSSSSTFDFTLNSLSIVQGNATAATNSIWGTVFIDLSTGSFNASTAQGTTTSGTTAIAGSGQSFNTAGNIGYTTATTSITFAVSAGSFDSGTIKVYGVA